MSRKPIGCRSLQTGIVRNSLGCWLVVAILLLRVAEAADDPDQVASAKANAALVARLNGLQNLVVDYKLHENNTPPLELVGAIAAMNKQDAGKGITHQIHSGPQDSICTFRYLDGRYWFEQRVAEADRNPTMSSFKQQIHCLNRDGFERYTLAFQPFKDMGMGTRCIRPQEVMAYPQQLLDIGLGLREWEANDWVTPEALKDMIVRFTDDGLAELQRLDPKMHRVHVWNFDPRNDYALARYTMYYGDFPGVKVVCSDFRNVDGLQLAFKIDIQQFAQDNGNKIQVRQTTMHLMKVQLHAPENTADSFHITWPVNTAISDRKSGKSFILKSEAQTLDDQKIENIVKTRSEQLIGSPQQRAPAN